MQGDHCDEEGKRSNNIEATRRRKEDGRASLEMREVGVLQSEDRLLEAYVNIRICHRICPSEAAIQV